MSRNGSTLPRETPKDTLDKLITRYEQNNPSAGKVIQTTMNDSQLAKFAARIGETNRWNYRSRILERVQS